MQDKDIGLGHTISSGYHGTEVQPQYRGIAACEQLWNREITVGSFDELIYEQLKNAKQSGRDKVVVLDIGSGKGNLFREYLAKDESGQKGKEFLTQNPDFNIEMIGITDAQSVGELLKEEGIVPKGSTAPPYENKQIKAKNIKYTLTYQQGINNVLQAQNIEGIDLCVSTVALTYLGPQVFERTIEEIVDKLHPGGQMVAYDYSGITPGIIQPDPMFLALDVRNIPDLKTTSSLKATLHEGGIRFARNRVDPHEEEEKLEEGEQLMVRLGIVDQEEINNRKREFLAELEQEDDRGMALMRTRTPYLSEDEKALIDRHILKIRGIKKQQLATFFKNHANDIEGDYKEATLFFRKLESID